MKQYTYALLFIVLLLGCTPPHHPKNPNYGIEKPSVKYQPNKKNLGKMVKQLQGSPYVWAEEGPSQFDCSGFTYYMYGSMGINIPRVARHQARVGKRVSPKDLRYGDLIFFATSKKSNRKITHVGMYLGDGWFTHASTIKHEVIYSNLFTSSYYKNKLRVCRRYLPENTSRTAKASTPVWKRTKSAEVITKPSIIATIQQPEIPKKGSSAKKAIVIQAPIEEIEQTHTSGNYYIQVGSFIGNPKNTLINKIRRQGFNHKIIKFPKGDKQISKLLIGAYVTQAEATSALKKVKISIQKDAFIAEIR
ncbi:MAG: NlpC/P60 family protein [Sulfurovum sp.]|nr:NlpC/P60 family protein [Sulfurovum sp.]